MRKYVLLSLLCACSSIVHAQSWESIKSNPEYYSGEGWGASLAEADQAALSALVSSISVVVSSEFVLTEEENSTQAGFDAASYVDSKVKTYSQGTLNNTRQMIISNEPDAHVFRYMLKSDLTKVFEARKAKVLDYVASAVKSESEGKVDNALRYYYWAHMLLKSLQDPTKATYTDETGTERLLITWIPERMNAIFDDLRVKVTRIQGGDIDLFFTFRGKPVANVDYAYFDGSSWSAIYSARDGRGTLELPPDAPKDNFHLKFEFEYRGEAQIDKEIESVVSVVKGVPMRKSYVHVPGVVETPQQDMAQASDIQSQDQTTHTMASANGILQPEMANNATSSTASALTLSAVEDCDDYQKVVDRIAKSIISKSYSGVDDCFTPEGLDVYRKLITYGKARLVGDTQCQFYRCGNDVIGRSIPMSFSFRNGARKSFVEQVVFTFEADSKRISNIAFGLGEQAEHDILNKGRWAESARTALMNFLENYKTAYSLKRMDYIENVFSDDAIIVTGKVAQRMELVETGDGQRKWQNNRYVKLTRQGKNEYLKNLQRCFNSNEYINIRFANNDVMKLGKGGEVYGIQIRQDYFSTNYGDTGYLFLMVDINDPDKPIIEVRTWQPEKDPNFGILGPGDF